MKQWMLLLTGMAITFLACSREVQTVTRIGGIAPKYIGKQIDLYQITDYITMTQERIASAIVREDSTFSLSFFLTETQKLILSSDNNTATLYAAPGGSYDVFLPDKNPYDPYRPLGNKVEVTFFGLDSTDINYKILTFNRWMDEMIARYYTKNNAESGHFAKRLETFKSDVAAYYASDTTDAFFRSHVRYSLARIDNMYFIGSRNRIEKYDFYLRTTPMYYQSDSYMNYVGTFYDKVLTKIDMEISNRFYLGLLKSSPTLIMNALGQEYTLHNNIRLREAVMIKTLGSLYYERDYPQTNILSVLDSVSKHALFAENGSIAKNMILRLTELSQGAKAPDFTLTAANGLHNLDRYKGKFLYIFFVNPTSVETRKQTDLLQPIYRRYSDHVRFLMVIRNEGADSETIAKLQQSVPWESVIADPKNAIFKNYQVINMPYYVLIDPVSYVVSAPALGPLPNGQYETIDKLFFQIKKAIDEGRGDGR